MCTFYKDNLLNNQRKRQFFTSRLLIKPSGSRNSLRNVTGELREGKRGVDEMRKKVLLSFLSWGLKIKNLELKNILSHTYLLQWVLSFSVLENNHTS